MLFASTLLPTTGFAKLPPKNYFSHHKASLLADADSGRILYAHRIEEKVYPASLVKMMTALITLEEVKQGRISMNDRVRISAWASKIGGRQVYLKHGEVFPLAELMKAMVITSANDAAVAIAEHVAGNDKNFIMKMNHHAKKIGMRNTSFFSVHGLPPGRGQKLDRTTARDLLILSLELLKHPRYLAWSSIRLDRFRNGAFQLLNTNHKLLSSFKGMDGMKTGYHARAGFNLVSTAKRNGVRLLSIVLGARNPRWRRKITSSILNHGFSEYRKITLIAASDIFPHSLQVTNGVRSSLGLKTQMTLKLLLSQSERSRIISQMHVSNSVEAPVREGKPLGMLEYRLDGNTLGRIPLVAAESVEEAGMLSLLAKSLFNYQRGLR